MGMDRRVFWRGALLFVLLLAFAIRVSGLTAQSMWRDEVDAIQFSQMPLSVMASYFTRPGWNGPLFYLFLRPWIAIAGRTEFGLRYFSSCLSVIAVALLYRLAQTWFSKPVGVLAALLMATSAYMVWYAQELKMYALVCALVLATLLLYHRALRSGDWRIWTLVIVLAWVTAATHIMGSLLVLVIVGLYFAWWPATRTQYRVALVVLGGMALPGILVAPWALPTLIRGGSFGHAFVPLSSMIRTLFHAFSQGITNLAGILPIGVTVFGMVAGTALWTSRDRENVLWRSSQGGGQASAASAVGTKTAAVVSVLSTETPCTLAITARRYVVACWVWLVVPVVALYAITLRVPMFVDRYLIWIGPALYLLVARGVEQIWRRSKAVAILLSILLLLFAGWGIWEQASTPIKSDFRSAAAYVRQHRRPDELVLFHISYVRATFEFYYGDVLPFADGIATDENTTAASVDAAMQQRVTGHDTVWLVLSEPEMWDHRGMTVAWLNEHAQQVSRQDFARVAVIQYRLISRVPSCP
jgi:uncharacterized membrane protein